MYKICTSIEQSKKLSEFLPLESADMDYIPIINIDGEYSLEVNEWDNEHVIEDGWIPCWSLAALIDILPEDIIGQRHYFFEISKMGDASTPHEVRYYRFRDESDGGDFGRITWISHQANNLVDACVEMILKLHELKML